MQPPIYLSSDMPNWNPATEADIQTAIDEGLIDETHYMDAKREVKTGGSANKETAKDMASFAIDGGILIVGIEEDKTAGTFSLAPQPLKGLPERVEQIARSQLIEQPLNVITRPIPSVADPTQGYLLIIVPVSPAAPHMVDGRYIGRGDKTKIYLSDTEVSRLHERRAAAAADGIKLMRDYMAKDPIEHPENAHFFVLAEPVSGREGMLQKITNGVNASKQADAFKQAAFSEEVKKMVEIENAVPSLTHAYSLHRIQQGIAQTTGRDRVKESDTLVFEVHEDGGLRMFTGRFSDSSYPDRKDQLLDDTAIVLVHQMIALIKSATAVSGYTGNWVIAVGGTGMKGKFTHMLHNYDGDVQAKYKQDADDYVQTCTATYAQLVQSPRSVAEKLLGKLMRSLDTDRAHSHALQEPDTEEA